MDSKSYLSLNAWLQKSDSNYISGRLLWLNALIDGSSNLLWLGCEQIIKILLLQKEIDNISSECTDLDEMHVMCESKGKGYGHKVDVLVGKLEIEYPEINLNPYKPALEKLHEYFFRRYVVRAGSSISLLLLDQVDELYFKLRRVVHPDVGLGTVDEIYIQKKHSWGHPLPAFAYAYLQNKAFGPRPHRQINMIGPDKQIYKEDGT